VAVTLLLTARAVNRIYSRPSIGAEAGLTQQAPVLTVPAN